MENKIKKCRLLYIDRIKGIAIFLVVLAHFYLFCFNNSNNFVFKTIGYFHMPLFMFISGYLSYISNYIDIYRKISRRLISYIFPMYLFGWFLFLFCKYILNNNCVYGNLINYTIFGNWYWYLKCISIFAICSLYNNIVKNLFKDIFIFLLIYILFFIGWKNSGILNDIFYLEHCTCFYPFYFLGFLAKKYGVINRFICNMYVVNICFLCFLCFLFFLFSYTETNLIIKIISRLILPTTAIIYIFSSLKKTENITNNIIYRILEYFGSKSLDIYLLHYFFLVLCNFNIIYKWTDSTNNCLIEFFIASMMSLIICYLSIITSLILKQLQIFDKIIYGKFLQ